MKSGRFLDILVAEKIFDQPSFEVPETVPVTATFLKDRELRLIAIPHYSTSIADAWEVVEKIDANGLSCSITQQKIGWTCEFEVRPKDLKIGRSTALVKGETAPHAICLAALKAFGIEI